MEAVFERKPACFAVFVTERPEGDRPEGAGGAGERGRSLSVPRAETEEGREDGREEERDEEG